ncbi:MAG: hypothetical protein FWG14_04245 [Peptococcaceae bacterium]|nr:hypothetical protein [Peptococcaceae bacterium]
MISCMGLMKACGDFPRLIKLKDNQLAEDYVSKPKDNRTAERYRLAGHTSLK